jgi:hypothetical protein
MQTPQLYARNAVRTIVNVAIDEAGCTIADECSSPAVSYGTWDVSSVCWNGNNMVGGGELHQPMIAIITRQLTLKVLLQLLSLTSTDSSAMRHPYLEAPPAAGDQACPMIATHHQHTYDSSTAGSICSVCKSNCSCSRLLLASLGLPVHTRIVPASRSNKAVHSVTTALSPLLLPCL